MSAVRIQSGLSMELSLEDIEQRTVLVNQFHIIAHALAHLQFHGINEVFQGLYHAIIDEHEVKMESFISCQDASQRVDTTRTYDQYKTDALDAIANFEKLPKTEKYKGKLDDRPFRFFSEKGRLRIGLEKKVEDPISRYRF